MSYESRSLDIKEALFAHGGLPPRTLRVTEHRKPEFVYLEILADSAEPECEMVVDIGVLRGFLTWLRDGD